MRECTYKTGFEFTKSQQFEFTTIPEAAAIYYLSVIRNITHNHMEKFRKVADSCWRCGSTFVAGDKVNKRTKDGMYLYFHELAKRVRDH
ncbi:hypothetical protein RhiirA4_486158 [Rhizophagus irregularis]|uniref:Uncharacterized protein n=1 Tax=Rhizophagus irregularis TaxID=588596 RepID=A0A2I1HR41_9GLOM|nr:hypothetical protein RhiirA4_486158 [Rhizophagus irregularis]